MHVQNKTNQHIGSHTSGHQPSSEGRQGQMIDSNQVFSESRDRYDGTEPMSGQQTGKTNSAELVSKSPASQNIPLGQAEAQTK